MAPLRPTHHHLPQSPALESSRAHAHPLGAFAVLTSGAVFEGGGRAPPPQSLEPIAAHWSLRCSDPRLLTQAHQALERQLGYNPQLIRRILDAKPLRIDIATEHRTLVPLGFPPRAAQGASGLFWDHPDWSTARIGIVGHSFAQDSLVLHHEIAHALHHLCMSTEERDLIQSVLGPTFGGPTGVAEAFAIYSEREFCATFDDLAKRAPGVYGFTRRQWDENHLFTRFVRKLYFPYKPLAGPGMSSPSSGMPGHDWMKKLGR